MLTDEQFNALRPFEQTFRSALNNNFIRVTGDGFKVIASVYDQLFNPLRPSQRNCNSCRLTAIKTMGRIFIDDKARREKEEAEKAQSVNAAEVQAPKKNKGGRPKKIKLED